MGLSGVLRMMKHGPFLVQQVVDAEFDASSDDPSQGAIVMIYDIMHEEGIVGSTCLGRY